MQGTTEEILTVRNPRSEAAEPVDFKISERLDDLNGKTVGIYWNGKPDGDYFWDTIESLLKHKYPTVKVKRYNGPGDVGDELGARMAKEIDTFLYGVGD